MNINITTETNRLNAVIVHTPGKEVSLVNPATKDELLFDDIIYEADARKEHLGMLEIFRTAMPDRNGVLEITDLLPACLENPDARTFLVRQLVDHHPELNLHTIEGELNNLGSPALLEFVITGTTSAIPGFILHPSPNLLFTRDLAAVIPNGIIISRTAKKARLRESLMLETLVKFHPLFASVKEDAIYIGLEDSVEGGDILIASPDLVIIGMSERTSFSGIMGVADALLDRGIKNVMIVDIIKQRSSMHLDTIFTFCGPDECIVYPPAIMGKKNNVVVLSKREGEIITKVMYDVQTALETLLNREFNFIKCGGEDLTNQHREQWTDGANVFALAPGIIVGYGRNSHTFDALSKNGYTIMDQYDFIEKYRDKAFDPGTGDKIAVTFDGAELCRGRGGARCMTMPISRD
ncbi:MAG: arginine deiminase family protein [Balneolales bacterium]